MRTFASRRLIYSFRRRPARRFRHQLNLAVDMSRQKRSLSHFSARGSARMPSLLNSRDVRDFSDGIRNWSTGQSSRIRNRAEMARMEKDNSKKLRDVNPFPKQSQKNKHSPMRGNSSTAGIVPLRLCGRSRQSSRLWIGAKTLRCSYRRCTRKAN